MRKNFVGGMKGDGLRANVASGIRATVCGSRPPAPARGTNWELFLALTSCCNSAGNTVLRCCLARKQTLAIGDAHSAYDHKRTEVSEKESRVVIATEKVNYGQARMQPMTEPDEGLKDRVFSERPRRRGGVCRLRSPRDEYYARLDVNIYRIG